MRAADLVGVEPIASIMAGSDLYNTKIDDHDEDVALFVPFGKSVQAMEGKLDVRVITVESLIHYTGKGTLYETDCALGLLYGHGSWYDHTWRPVLEMYRPSIYHYADTVRRFKKKNPTALKHIIRYDIFLRRFWDTGNADPRLSDKERQEWHEKLHSST